MSTTPWWASGGGGGGGGTTTTSGRRNIFGESIDDKPKEKDDDDKSEEEKAEEAATNLARYIGRLGGLARSGDEKAGAKFRQYLWQYGDVIENDEFKKYGVTDDELERWSSEGAISKGSWQETAVGGAATVLSPLERPFQALAGYVRAFNQEKDSAIGWALGEGYTSSEESSGETSNPWVGAWRGLTGKTHYNFREMALQDPNAGGTAGDIADFVGTMAADPLNLVSGGSGQLAKGAFRTLGKEVATRELAEVAAREGLGAIDDAGRATMREALAASVEEGSRGAGRSRILRQPLEDLVPGLRGTGATPGERYANRAMTEIGRRGTGGLVIGGRTVRVGRLSTGGRPLTRALNAAGLPGWHDLTATARADLSKGNLAIQGAADDYTVARQKRGLRVVRDEVPEFVVNDPEALEVGTVDQFGYMTAPKDKNGLGLTVEFVDEAPYKTAAERATDVAENGRIKVQKGVDNAARAAGLPDEVADQFQAAQEVFGHVLSGSEDAAVASAYHGQMFSSEAMRLAGVRSAKGGAKKAAEGAARAGGAAADDVEARPAGPAGSTGKVEPLTEYETRLLQREVVGQASDHGIRASFNEAGIPHMQPLVDDAGRPNEVLREFYPEMKELIDSKVTTWTERDAIRQAAEAGDDLGDAAERVTRNADGDVMVDGFTPRRIETALADHTEWQTALGKFDDELGEAAGADEAWEVAAGLTEGAEDAADALADVATDGDGPLGEAIREARRAAEATTRERAINKARKAVEPVFRRKERARVAADEAQEALEDLRADLSATLDESPRSKTYGQGKLLGEAGRAMDDAARAEAKASARVAGARRRVELLEKRLEKAGGAESDVKDALIDKVEEGTRPGFVQGRRLGKAEGRRRALAQALNEARTEAARAERQAAAANETAWTAQQRYAGVLGQIEEGLGASGDTLEELPTAARGAKAKATYGMGKRMEKAERRARDTAKAAADADWAYQEAERAIRASGADVRDAITTTGDRAATRALRDTAEPLLPTDTLGRTGASATGATPLRETRIIKKGARRRLLEGGFEGAAKPLNTISRVANATNTRMALGLRVGEGARLRGEVSDVATRTAAFYENNVGPLVDRLSHLVRKAKVDAPTLREMYDALEGGRDAVDDLATRLTGESRDLLLELQHQRQAMTEALVEAGVVDKGILDNVDSYMLRLMTDEGEKALKDVAVGGEELVPKVAGRKGSDLAQGGSLERRRIRPEDTLAELEENPDVLRLKRDRGLEEGAELYERNPVISVAARGATAYGAVAEAQTYRALANVATDAGEPLMVVASRGDDVARRTAAAKAKRLGYEAIELSDAADVVAWAPADVASELGRMRDVVFNDDSMQAWTNFVDRWQRVWKSSATVPITSGFGFITRNVQGNLFNNFIRGVSDPLTYAEALRLQVYEYKAGRIMREEGVGWEDAIDRVLADAGRVDDPTEGARRIFTGRGREKAVLRKARDNGVFSQGFYTADLNDDVLDRLASTSRGKRIRQNLNPISPEGIIVRTGAGMNEMAEHNARLAHFIDKFDKLGNATDAMRSVKETLFDYSDLTAFERNKLRRINGFYTWTRKNVPLQFRALKEAPARVNRVATAEQRLLTEEGGEGQPDTAYSNFALAGGQGPLGSSLPGFIRGAGGSKGALIGVETPTEAMVETILPVVQLAAMAAPGTQRNLEPLGGGGNYLDRLGAVGQGALGWTAGGPVEAVDFVYGLATGIDSFTGAPATDASGKIKRDKEQTFFDALNVLLPGASKSKGLYEGLTNSGKYRESPTSMTRATLLRMTLGVQLTPQDARTEKGELWRRYYEMQNAINEAFPDGIPTLEEMRDDEDRYGVPSLDDEDRPIRGGGGSAFSTRSGSGGGGAFG